MAGKPIKKLKEYRDKYKIIDKMIIKAKRK